MLRRKGSASATDTIKGNPWQISLTDTNLPLPVPRIACCDTNFFRFLPLFSLVLNFPISYRLILGSEHRIALRRANVLRRNPVCPKLCVVELKDFNLISNDTRRGGLAIKEVQMVRRPTSVLRDLSSMNLILCSHALATRVRL